MRARRSSREERRIDWVDRLLGPLPDREFPVGRGDDAAVWRPRAGRSVVLTVDAQAEGTHFRRDWLTPREIGRRAVAASVSDVAAMAARPAAILVSLLLDHTVSESEYRGLVRGIRDAALEFGVAVAGGNISRGPLSVTVTSLGDVDATRPAVRRNGARAGDEVWVTGSPGLARLGWLALDGALDVPRRDPRLRRALRAFRRPVPRIREALRLRRYWPLTALIDLSDGLTTDLRHLVDASFGRAGKGLGVALDPASIQGLPDVGPLCRRAGLSALDICLAGGEDYELLFTARPRAGSVAAARTFASRTGVPLTRIGTMTRGGGIHDATTGRPLVAEGFEHL